MGTDHDGNKKWTGLKRPVGMLFSPRGQKRGTVTIGNRKSEDPAVENVSGITSSTENLTEADESPTTGKPNMIGRSRRQEDEVTLTPGGHSTGKSKRRPSGAMNLLRKAMFAQNPKEDISVATEASRDKRETPTFGIDTLFDDDLTSSRQSSVKPPSCSDLSSSAAHSSRTDMSGMSHRLPTPLGPDADSGRNAASRSPRPMQTGVRNTLVSAKLNPSASNNYGAMDASFHPTLSQKLKIGKEEIEKKMEARKIPPIEPLKLAPLTKGQDRRAVGAPKVGSNTSSKSSSSTAKSTGTRRKSGGSDAVRREYEGKEAREVNPESPGRPTTPTVLHDRSKASSQQSRHRRPHHSREKPEERHRQNSDGTSRSRGRSGPRHSYDHSPKTPGSQHSTKERRKVRARPDESSGELPTMSNLDGSPSRTRHGSTKSPSRDDRRHDRQQGNDKRHVGSQDARNHASRREERRAAEEKKRSKSFDESKSRDKSVQHGQPDSVDHHYDPETDRSHSSGKNRKRDHSSPHSRESHRTRTEKSPKAVERKRSKSMDDSQGRSKSPHHLSRKASYNSQDRSHSSGHHGHRGDSSPHNQAHRKRTEKSPATEERKRSNSMDDSQSRSKSPHHQSRRSSYDSRSHSSGHRRQRGESSPHSRESHRKRTEKSLEIEDRKRSTSMDDSQSRSQSRHQQSRRSSYDSRHQSHNKEQGTGHSRSRSREASAHSNDLLSPNLSVRKRSLSLDESRSRSRRSLHGSENGTAEQEDKITTMNELWNELTKYGPPHLKKQESERSQKVVSKAERQRRDELGKSNRRTATSRPSHSPGRLSTNHHDDDGTVNSGGTMSRRQTRRERKEKGDDTSSSRPSRQSTSPSHRSSSSSHRQAPPTPSGRSERSATRSTSREKWSNMLHRNDTTTDTTDAVEVPFPTAVSTDESEIKSLNSQRSVSTDKSEVKPSTSPRSVATDESKGKTSIPLRTDIETPTQDETTSDSNTTNAPGPTPSIPPPMPNSQDENYQKIPPSAILTPNHYKAVNKMADRIFHSPLGDPPGTYSPTQRQGNGRTKLLASSSSSSKSTAKEGKLPVEEQTGNANTTTTKQDDDVLLSPTSRAAKLKNHLRQLELQHGSLNSSHRSRSEPPISTRGPRNTRRQRSNEDSGGGTTGSGRPRPPPTSHNSTSSTSTSRPRERRESTDHSRRHRQLIPQSDNSPGHGSSQASNTTTTMTIKAPPTTTTKDLGRFLKSPKPDKDDETAKSKLGAKTILSIDSVPVSESTTES